MRQILQRQIVKTLAHMDVIKAVQAHIAECVQHARRDVMVHVRCIVDVHAKEGARIRVEKLAMMAAQGGAGQVVMGNVQVLAIRLVSVLVNIRWIR